MAADDEQRKKNGTLAAKSTQAETKASSSILLVCPELCSALPSNTEMPQAAKGSEKRKADKHAEVDKGDGAAPLEMGPHLPGAPRARRGALLRVYG